MTQLINARKNGRRVLVELPSHHVFRRPKVYEPIDFSRIVGVDSESFSNRKYSGDLRTNMVQVAYCNSEKDVILDTTKEDHPLGVVFDEIWDAQDELLNIPKYRVKEDNPSR